MHSTGPWRGGPTWTVHTIREHVTRISTDHGLRATFVELREFVQLATDLARGDCLSVLPPGAVPASMLHLSPTCESSMQRRSCVTRMGVQMRSHLQSSPRTAFREIAATRSW